MGDDDMLDTRIRNALHSAVDDWQPNVDSATGRLQDAIGASRGPGWRAPRGQKSREGRRRLGMLRQGLRAGWALPVAAVMLATAVAAVPTLVYRTHTPASTPGGSHSRTPGPPAQNLPAPTDQLSLPPALYPPGPSDLPWQLHTATKLCGPGYRHLDGNLGVSLPGTGRTRPPETIVYLFWNARSGTACVATVKARKPHTGTRTTAYLQPDRAPRSTATGADQAVVHLRVPTTSMPGGGHTPYNPPAFGGCIRWGGSDGTAQTSFDNTRFDNTRVYYTSFANGDQWPCP